MAAFDWQSVIMEDVAGPVAVAWAADVESSMRTPLVAQVGNSLLQFQTLVLNGYLSSTTHYNMHPPCR